MLTFAELKGKDGAEDEPVFEPVGADSVVFAPHNVDDEKGTEDPRVAYDPSTGLYHMLYTCYGNGEVKVEMCHATTTDPTSKDGWTRLGPVGFGSDSKSGAMFIREEGPHYMYWGAGRIHISQSSDLVNWTQGERFIDGPTAWGNPNVEAGPPPMQLSTGDYVFFFNSWGQGPGYQPAWAVVSGNDPTKILAMAQEPLWSPQSQLWMTGEPPYQCNVEDVAFLEAAHPVGDDTFRVYFGGADAVIGTAIVRISQSEVPCDQAALAV